jgi:hypothetical protein
MPMVRTEDVSSVQIAPSKVVHQSRELGHSPQIKHPTIMEKINREKKRSAPDANKMLA